MGKTTTPKHKPGAKKPRRAATGFFGATANETSVANGSMVQRELHAPRSGDHIKHSGGGCSRTLLDPHALQLGAWLPAQPTMLRCSRSSAPSSRAQFMPS